jgi:hypothetical protein
MRWLDPAGVPTLGSHEGLKASDVDGAVIPTGVAAYQKAESGGPELFAELSEEGLDQPWLAVTSLENPHDISFAGGLYKKLLGFHGSDDTVPARSTS